MRALLLACATLLVCASSALAQGPPDAAGEGGRVRRVVVMLLAAPGVDPELADALTEVAIGAIAARGEVSIVGKEEFQAQLGQGEERSLECVSSTACVGRIGVQLDVDEVVAGTLNARGGQWLFNLNRIDIRTGELVGRAFREVEGDPGALATAIQEAVPALYEVVREPSTLEVTASVEGAQVEVDGALVGSFSGEPVRLPDFEPGSHEVRVMAPGHQAWVRTIQIREGTTLQVEAFLEPILPPGGPSLSPLLFVGGGVAAGAGLLGLVFGLRSQQDLAEGTPRGRALRYVSDRERDALIANLSFGVAAAGAVLGIVGLLLSDLSGDEPPTASVGLSPARGGAALTLSGAL